MTKKRIDGEDGHRLSRNLGTASIICHRNNRKRIQEATGLSVHRYKSGPLGGDQQIGAMISEDALDMVIFCAILWQRNHMSRM